MMRIRKSRIEIGHKYEKYDKKLPKYTIWFPGEKAGSEKVNELDPWFIKNIEKISNGRVENQNLEILGDSRRTFKF